MHIYCMGASSWNYWFCQVPISSVFCKIVRANVLVPAWLRYQNLRDTPRRRSSNLRCETAGTLPNMFPHNTDLNNDLYQYWSETILPSIKIRTCLQTLYSRRLWILSGFPTCSANFSMFLGNTCAPPSSFEGPKRHFQWRASSKLGMDAYIENLPSPTTVACFVGGRKMRGNLQFHPEMWRGPAVLRRR